MEKKNKIFLSLGTLTIILLTMFRVPNAITTISSVGDQITESGIQKYYSNCVFPSKINYVNETNKFQSNFDINIKASGKNLVGNFYHVVMELYFSVKMEYSTYNTSSGDMLLNSTKYCWMSLPTHEGYPYFFFNGLYAFESDRPTMMRNNPMNLDHANSTNLCSIKSYSLSGHETEIVPEITTNNYVLLHWGETGTIVNSTVPGYESWLIEQKVVGIGIMVAIRFYRNGRLSAFHDFNVGDDGNPEDTTPILLLE